MKKMKKLASLIMAVVMVLSMTVAAFADDVETPKGDGKFTITLENENSGHTYTAYQVFQGDLFVENVGTDNEKKTLSNVEWAGNVNTTNLIATIKACNNAFAGLGDNASARDVAEVLAKQKDDSDIMQAFVQAIKPFLGNSTHTSTEVTTTDAEGNSKFAGKYEISELEAGYYLVEDTVGGNQEGDAYSRYILEVVADVVADVKTSTPTVEKKIVTGPAETDRADANTAGIGQVVSYEITGTVPDYQSYDQYFYVINDILSDGLTFNNDVTVTVNGTELVPETDYYLYTKTTEPAVDSPYTFEIAFKNIKNYTTGQKIIVNYSAIVNDDAVTGVGGNPNTVTLKYSNNPNFKGDGENPNKPGTPDPSKDVPTGISPEDKTITYVAEIDITKYAEDANGGKEILPGATFTLTGNSDQVVLSERGYFEVADNGTYYLLKDGTYTTDEPQAEVKDENDNVTVESNEGDYVSTTVKYIYKTVITTTVVSTPVKMVVTSNNEGKVIFKSLGKGTYKIEETGVPAGYNKAEDIMVQIDCTVPTEIKNDSDNDKATWTVGAASTAGVISVVDGNIGVYTLDIINRAGSLLPSTGGIGTTIFYAAGIILMAGAVFFVVRRKRA